MDFKKFLSFSRLLNAFARIERTPPMPGTKRYENDMEHSYHLALMAWYLIDSRKLDLDMNLVLKYALAHDLVEVYAGDTYIYSTDAEHVASKKEREHKAAGRLMDEFPEFRQLHSVIEEYEKRANRESRFVYALDKILPIVLIREDGGKEWRKRNVTLDTILKHKAAKVALSPEIEPYFNQLVELLRKEKITAEP
ncbi:MAG: hypothetical protein QOE22_24 [Candidatus Parcubacteria bacterium]|jgi:putative hydrolase of HD superfamily|nr:hypothetical protein [Candidatus Parcubacteria bacterium]